MYDLTPFRKYLRWVCTHRSKSTISSSHRPKITKSKNSEESYNHNRPQVLMTDASHFRISRTIFARQIKKKTISNLTQVWVITDILNSLNSKTLFALDFISKCPFFKHEKDSHKC